MYVRLHRRHSTEPRRPSRLRRVLALAGLAAAFAAVPLASAEAQAPRSCGIARLQGEAAIERGGQLLIATQGAVIGAQDTLASGPDSRVEIRCNDGTRLNLGADTRLEMATLVGSGAAAQNVVLRLLNGIVRVALPAVRSWRRFEVQTPSAVASVRATDWIVQVERDGATAIFVVEGQVLAADLPGSKGAFLLAGDGIDFSADGAMAATVRWGPPRVQRTLAAVMPR